MKTKAVHIKFSGPLGKLEYEKDLPAGLRVKSIPVVGTQRPNEYWLDQFPLDLFPINSFERHDATHYGVRLTREQVE